MISPELRGLVRVRADYRCEYCQLSEHHSPLNHRIKHIVAKQHDGSDDPVNLALTCHRCDLRKGPNLTAIDPETRDVVLLFNPRKQPWLDHFRMTGARIEGTTAMGRATVRLLTMNDERRLELRHQILGRGL